MSLLRSAWFGIAGGFVVGVTMVFQLHAQPATPANPASTSTGVLTPPMPQTKSPVDLFRDLLAMTPVERKNYLTNRPPEMRARILEKLKEYEVLDPNERELRLRATELLWYLPPLMHVAPKDRAAQLAPIPPDMRQLVEDRLAQWDILPPPLQQELLDSEQALGLFTHVDNGGHKPGTYDRSSSTNHYSWEAGLARWNALPEARRKSLSEQFSRFFDLTPSEKKKTLNTLSDAERREMEKTLQAFEKLPRAQRLQCIRSFEQFSSLSPQERFEFLKNAERWSQMPPAERQTWRSLVARVPQWPPLPPGMNQPDSPPMPPLPQTIQPKIQSAPALVTNAN